MEEDHNKHKGLKDEIEKLESDHNSRVKEYEVRTRSKDVCDGINMHVDVRQSFSLITCLCLSSQ